MLNNYCTDFVDLFDFLYCLFLSSEMYMVEISKEYENASCFNFLICFLDMLICKQSFNT